MKPIRLLLLLQGGSLLVAALVHGGVIIGGYEHQRAATAESVIGSVLLAALALTWLRPSWTRTIGIAAQAFGLVGTLVGAFTIAIGVGPRTAPDIAYHAVLLVLLVLGLWRAILEGGAARAPRRVPAP
jgi:hypothetical protein